MGLLTGEGMHQAVECKSMTCMLLQESWEGVLQESWEGVCSPPTGKSCSDQQELLVLDEVMASGDKPAGSLVFTQVAPALKVWVVSWQRVSC